jgi:hypothetical protein
MKVYVVVQREKDTGETELVVGYRTYERAMEEIEDFYPETPRFSFSVECVDIYNDLDVGNR